MPNTKHAAARSQQRAIPPFVDRLLDEFGEEEHDGRGCVKVFFNHRSVREMERQFGREPVSLFRRYFTAYRVESSDGMIITKGWRRRRINRK